MIKFEAAHCTLSQDPQMPPCDKCHRSYSPLCAIHLF